MGIELPLGSKKDHDNKGFAALEAEDYIVKLGKVVLEQVPTWVNGRPDFNNTEFGYTVVASPVALKGGGVMRDVNGVEIKPFSSYIFRGLDPKSFGFQKDGSPSFMRAFICYLRNIPVNGNVTAENFFLITPDGKEVIADDDFRKQFIDELTGKTAQADRTLVPEGYKSLPDVTMYEGRYLSCAVEVGSNGKNKITKWSKLPANFEKPSKEAEAEFKTKVDEFWTKVKNKNSNGGSSSVESTVDEVVMEDHII